MIDLEFTNPATQIRSAQVLTDDMRAAADKQFIADKLRFVFSRLDLGDNSRKLIVADPVWQILSLLGYSHTQIRAMRDGDIGVDLTPQGQPRL